MKFYIGSGRKNCELVNYYAKVLKENGFEQTFDWVKNYSNDFNISDMREYATLEKQGIIDADMVIIILPAGFGSHTEFGMALALNKKLFLCATNEEEFNIQNTVAFYELPDVVKLVGSNDENLSKIIDYTNCKILKK